MAEAAHRLGDGREAGALGIGPGLAVARDAGENDAGVHRRQLLVAQVPPFERAGAEVLRDDVGHAGELEKELLAARVAQVQRDALLVPRLHRPPERATLVAGLAPLAEGVGLVGGLDLDHVGAHVSEQPAGKRAGEQRAQLDQPQARQGPRAARAGSSLIESPSAPMLYHAGALPAVALAATLPISSLPELVCRRRQPGTKEEIKQRGLMAELTKLESKLGEVTGPRNGGPGRDREGPRADATARMPRLATTTSSRCTRRQPRPRSGACVALAGGLDGKEDRDPRRGGIRPRARPHEMLKTYLDSDSEALDGFEFLTMAEAGEVGHWSILKTLNESAGDSDVAQRWWRGRCRSRSAISLTSRAAR